MVAAFRHGVETRAPVRTGVLRHEGVEVDAEQGVAGGPEERAGGGVGVGDLTAHGVDGQERVGDSVDRGDDRPPCRTRLPARAAPTAALTQRLPELLDQRRERAPHLIAIRHREHAGGFEPGVEQGGHASFVDLEAVEGRGPELAAVQGDAGEAAKAPQRLGLAARRSRRSRAHRVTHRLLDGLTLSDEPRGQRGVRMHIDESSGSGRFCRRIACVSREVTHRKVNRVSIGPTGEPIIGGMSLRTGPVRVLVAYARPECFIDKTESILARLGYLILRPDELEDRRGELPPGAPHLYVADERQLDEVPNPEGEAERPVIVLSGRQGIDSDDPRVVAAVRRPAGLHDLYCILQRVFELTPRSTPRIPVRIEVDCRRGDRHFEAEMRSISENGALLRCEDRLPLGSTFEMDFALPGVGSVQMRAEAAYQLMPDLGVVFSGVDASLRETINGFIAESILAA